MTAPNTTTPAATTSLADRIALRNALKQIIELNRIISIELRRDESSLKHIDLDIAQDLGLTLQRALDRAYDKAHAGDQLFNA